MTKAQMVAVIEKSGMVINFSRSYFMARPKSFVEKMYEDALAFMEKIIKKISEKGLTNSTPCDIIKTR